MSYRIFVHVSKVKSVSTIPEGAAGPEEHEQDGAPNHEAGQEPHEDDPDEGEEAGTDQSQSNHPVGVLQVAEDSLSELSEAEEDRQPIEGGRENSFRHIHSLVGVGGPDQDGADLDVVTRVDVERETSAQHCGAL